MTDSPKPSLPQISDTLAALSIPFTDPGAVEMLFRSAVESMHDGFCIQNDQTAILYWNRSAERILGLGGDQIRGRKSLVPFNNAIREDGSAFPPDDQPCISSLRTGKPLSGVRMGVYRPDGDLVWISVNAVPMKIAGQAKPHGVAVTFQDITAFKRSEGNLTQREAYFRTLIEYSYDIITVLDDDGVISFVSPSVMRILGYEPKQLLGKNIFDYVHPEDRQTVFDNFRRRLTHPEHMQTSRNRTLHKDGSWRWVESVSTLQQNDIGRRRVVMNSRDITDRAHLEVHLRQVDKMTAIGQLADGIAHELNNPLNVILGFAQSAAARLAPDDPAYRPLQTIERETRWCQTLVQNLVSFSQHTQPGRAPGNVAAAVTDALLLVYLQLKNRKIEIQRQIHDDLPKALLNHHQIQQVVLNLCSNAIDAMPTEGRLTVTVEPSLDGDAVVDGVWIIINDTGCGMTPEVQARVCEPYFTTKAPGEGTGLGLSIVHDIVEQHLGRLEIASQSGKGTAVRVWLPAIVQGA